MGARCDQRSRRVLGLLVGVGRSTEGGPRRPGRAVRAVDKTVRRAGVDRTFHDRGGRRKVGVDVRPEEELPSVGCHGTGTSTRTSSSLPSNTSSGTPPTVVVNGTNAVVRSDAVVGFVIVT